MGLPENMKGGSIFVLILILFGILPLLYLGLWGYQTQNLSAFIISTIFLLFIIIPFAFDFFKYMSPSDSGYGQASLSFTIGAIAATAINWNSAFQTQAATTPIQSIFSTPLNYLLSAISGQLPTFWNYYSNIFGAAISEESLFLITLPIIGFYLLDFAGKHLEILSNKYIQIAMVSAVVGIFFAVFHIGNTALIGFIVSAIIFRSFLIGIVHGESEKNILPWIVIVPSFAFGFHAFNNLSIFGFFNVFQVFLSEPLGIILTIFLVSTFVFGIRFGLQKLKVI